LQIAEERAQALPKFVDRLVAEGKLLMGSDGTPVLKGHAKPLPDFNKFTEQEIVEEFIKRYIREKELASGTVAERWAKVDQYVRDNPGKPVSSFAKKLFPEWTDQSLATPAKASQEIPALPNKAPKRWAERTGRVSPANFIRDVYGQWLGEGSQFTRATLRSLDKDLYTAYAQHIARHPEDSDLVSSHSEGVDNWTERVLRGELPEGEALDIRAVRRLLRTLERRENEAKSR
jgi:hypothetical protein